MSLSVTSHLEQGLLMVTSSKSDGFPHNRAMVVSRQSQILLTYWQSWGLSCWFRSSQDKAIASSIILRVLHPRERGRERRRNIFFSFLLAFCAAFVHLSCLIECWHLNEVKGRIATKFFWETIIGFYNDRGLFVLLLFQLSTTKVLKVIKGRLFTVQTVQAYWLVNWW